MKSIWASKTFWFNTVSLIITVVGELTNAFPTGVVAKYGAYVITIGNIILRLVTNTGIGTNKTP